MFEVTKKKKKKKNLENKSTLKIDRGGSTARAGLPTVSRPWTGPAKGLLRPCALGVFPGSRTDSRDCEGFRGAPDSGRTRPARERRGRGAQTSPHTGHDPPYTRGPRSETGCLWLRTPAPRTARSPGRQGQLLELESRVGCVGSSKNLGRAREGRAISFLTFPHGGLCALTVPSA